MTTEDQEKKCLGCKDSDNSTHMFEVSIYVEDLDDYVDEIYCNKCLANILTEMPECICECEAI